MGAVVAVGLWFGLSLWPNLLDARTLDDGAALGRLRDDRCPAIALSPLVLEQRTDHGADPDRPRDRRQRQQEKVFEGTAMRTCLFVGVALYAWGTILLLERWRPARLPAVRPKPASEKTRMTHNFLVGLFVMLGASSSRPMSPSGACATSCVGFAR